MLSKFPRRLGPRIPPEALPGRSGAGLQFAQRPILRIDPVPPGVPGADHLPVQALAVFQEYFAHGASVAVLRQDFGAQDFPGGEVGRVLTRLLPEGLGLLWRVDAREADLDRPSLVKNLQHVPVGDLDHLSGDFEPGLGLPVLSRGQRVSEKNRRQMSAAREQNRAGLCLELAKARLHNPPQIAILPYCDIYPTLSAHSKGGCGDQDGTGA